VRRHSSARAVCSRTMPAHHASTSDFPDAQSVQLSKNIAPLQPAPFALYRSAVSSLSTHIFCRIAPITRHQPGYQRCFSTRRQQRRLMIFPRNRKHKCTRPDICHSKSKFHPVEYHLYVTRNLRQKLFYAEIVYFCLLLMPLRLWL